MSDSCVLSWAGGDLVVSAVFISNRMAWDDVVFVVALLKNSAGGRFHCCWCSAFELWGGRWLIWIIVSDSCGMAVTGRLSVVRCMDREGRSWQSRKLLTVVCFLRNGVGGGCGRCWYRARLK